MWLRQAAVCSMSVLKSVFRRPCDLEAFSYSKSCIIFTTLEADTQGTLAWVLELSMASWWSVVNCLKIIIVEYFCVFLKVGGKLSILLNKLHLTSWARCTFQKSLEGSDIAFLIDKFQYLGSAISTNISIELKINSRITKASAVISKLHKSVDKKFVSKHKDVCL